MERDRDRDRDRGRCKGRGRGRGRDKGRGRDRSRLGRFLKVLARVQELFDSWGGAYILFQIRANFFKFS